MQKILRTLVGDKDINELIESMKKVVAEAKAILSYEKPQTYIAELVIVSYGEQERDKYVIAVSG